MSRIETLILGVLCVLLTSTNSHAAPSLTVAPLGPNGSNNREWAVKIAQDVVPGSLAAELAFAIDGADLLGVVVGDATIWDTPLPGNNPFTGTVTDGIYLDMINDRSFAAYGSAIITSTDPTYFLKITTAGAGPTTVRFGTAASGNSAKGNIIANSQGTFRYSGSASVPEPMSVLIVASAIAVYAVAGRRRC